MIYSITKISIIIIAMNSSKSSININPKITDNLVFVCDGKILEKNASDIIISLLKEFVVFQNTKFNCGIELFNFCEINDEPVKICLNYSHVSLCLNKIKKIQGSKYQCNPVCGKINFFVKCCKDGKIYPINIVKVIKSNKLPVNKNAAYKN